MMAEDSDDDVLLTTEALQEGGVGELCDVAYDGQQAMQLLDSYGDDAPDLMLLDVNLPIRNGFEILAKARLRHAFTQIPVIMISSSSRESDICQAYELGASAYLFKPSDYHDLTATLNAALTYFARLHGHRPHPGGG